MEDEAIDCSHILEKCYQQRLPYIKQHQLEAYRLYNCEDWEWPVAIDIYKSSAVIHCFEIVTDDQRKNIEAVLIKLLKIKNFFYKDRTKKDKDFPLDSETGIDHKLISSTQQQDLTIQEYGHTFLLNLADYIDTGIFLDHRETRHWIEAQSKGKTVLNTFAYTGSFSVYAAAGGATQTYSVDVSKTYCDWLRKNLIRNGFTDTTKHWVCRMDTFEFFQYAQRKNLHFDIIILDPPTFSRNKSSALKGQKNFSVQRDYVELMTEALKLLNPEGFILFSNNNQDFHLNEKKLPQCQIKNLNMIPPDFPVNYKEKQIHQSFIIQKH